MRAEDARKLANKVTERRRNLFQGSDHPVAHADCLERLYQAIEARIQGESRSLTVELPSDVINTIREHLVEHDKYIVDQEDNTLLIKW